MRPNMRQLEPGEPVLTTDSEHRRYIDAKMIRYQPVFGDNVDPNLIKRACVTLANHDPRALDIVSDCHSWDNGIWELSTRLQEDFVIWAPNRNGDLSAQILSVNLPSGWNPKTKVNKTFLEIHEPVPDFDTVNRAARHIAEMITQKGPFVRYVWTIANSDQLNRHPDLTKDWSDETINDMWFRYERQITLPMGDAALFLIRVYQIPLKKLFRSRKKKAQVIESIQSMTQAVLDYKNLNYVRSVLTS